MLKNQDIICISSIDWDFIWQGHQEIMSTLARNGNRIIFIENTGVRMPGIRDAYRIKNRIKNWFSGLKGIKQAGENLYIFSPLILPFPYFRPAIWINQHLILNTLKRWLKIMHFKNEIVWTFLPTPLSLKIIDDFDQSLLIYYCIDNFRTSIRQKKKIEKSEEALIKKADLVFVTSQELFNYCSSYSKKVYRFPFGVDYEQFEMVMREDGSGDILRNIKRPIVGYIGGLHKWVDFKLIAESAKKYPEISFVLIGPAQADLSILSGLENVHLLGKVEHSTIPRYIKIFDICIIPYLITEYTKNVYPTKLNEYMAMAKPVISTELPEVVRYNFENSNIVLVGKSHDEFINLIGYALNSSGKHDNDKRLAAAKNNSWAVRIEAMSRLIRMAIKERENADFDWKKSFVRLYRVSRRRILKLTFISVFIYVLIFYTPIIWFFAQPLKISQPPVKADAIVVFAGGVGESGIAGQGFEERTKYAIDLYRNGYSNNIIFSSGYTYAFKEPLVMKALAISFGVPENSIILDDRATNTYKNVKHTLEILRQKKWQKILLVSSPYNMLRASLVFRKLGNETEVIYTPIPTSLFYSRNNSLKTGEKKSLKAIKAEQIKAIFHEYLGIIYYLFKGYI